MSVPPVRIRLSGALAVSGGVHALVVAALVATHVEPPPISTPIRVLPVALVARLGGGPGEGPGPEPAPAPPAEVAAPAPVAPAPVPKPRVAKAPRPAGPKPAPPAESVASIAPHGSTTDAAAATTPGGGTGAAGDAGGGHGGGGDGGAQAAYGTNPLPPYPLAARRLGMEGVTLLDVVVAPDGKPVDVRVQKSSGFPPLDDSALKTVRERWRFVPAREGGTPVESRVTVPIRFRLAGAGS